MEQNRKKSIYGLLELKTYQKVFEMIGEDTKQIESAFLTASNMHMQGKYDKSIEAKEKAESDYIFKVLEFFKIKKNAYELGIKAEKICGEFDNDYKRKKMKLKRMKRSINEVE